MASGPCGELSFCDSMTALAISGTGRSGKVFLNGLMLLISQLMFSLLMFMLF